MSEKLDKALTSAMVSLPDVICELVRAQTCDNYNYMRLTLLDSAYRDCVRVAAAIQDAIAHEHGISKHERAAS